MIQLRASNFGGCIKAQVAANLGYEPMAPPDRMQAVFDRGNDHEDANLAVLLNLGYAIIDQQREVEFAGVVGHIDGIVYTDDFANRVWESKSPAAFDKFRDAYKRDDWTDPLATRYGWQISVYMHALGMEAWVTCLRDNGEIDGFIIERAPRSPAEIETRVEEIAGWVSLGELPGGCTSNDYPCPFYYLHDEPDLADDPILDELVALWVIAGEEEKAWTARKKDIQEQIRGHLAGQTEIETMHSRVTVYQQAGPARWDTDRMVEDGIDPDVYRIPGKPSERIKITRRTDG